MKTVETVITCKLKCEKTSVQAPQAFCVIAGKLNIQSRKRSNGFSFLNVTHYRETLGPFSKLRRRGGGGVSREESALVLWPRVKSSTGELPHPPWSLSSVLRPKGSLMGMLLNK